MNDTLKNHAGFIGWLIIVLVVCGSLFWQYELSQRLEAEGIARHIHHCRTTNNLKGVMNEVLNAADLLGNGEVTEERQHFRDEVAPLLEQVKCLDLIDVPPPPLPGQMEGLE